MTTTNSVQILDEAPKIMDRPLAIIDGCTYCATWLWVEETVSKTRTGRNVVQHDPPVIVPSRELFIMRHDGVLFGPGAEYPLASLGIRFSLPEGELENDSLYTERRLKIGFGMEWGSKKEHRTRWSDRERC